MDRDRAVELATILLAGVLFVLSAIGLVVAVRGGDGVVSALFGVYLTGLLLAGVLRDATNARGWQLAFFGGVAVWGGYEYATAGDLFSLLLAVVGVAMVAANLRDLR
ncbi:hypothetical protein [Halorussus aquaticus]|uniref:SPW repeat-containing protein n=1 Tax=Halorussus aquaticus TaxID=2953748 RepID=A0ABD5Q5T5_9EURY|nr:hypothetical protein [Halorussus aquaticus]